VIRIAKTGTRAAGLAGLMLIAACFAATAAPLDQLRLDPGDIAALAKVGAGAGTSGVSGIETTVLLGDPKSAGPYAIALRVPAHTTIAAHTHRDDRTAIVVSGIWWFGYGPVNTEENLKPLAPRSYYTEPGGQAHFARTGDAPVVVYITGSGPTDTVYVDAAAAPQP
jgi:hypothetical protein